MNLLDFPNEILMEFCRHMDFKSRVSFRMSCRKTNQIVDNPKYFVSDEQMKEWLEKMKILMGMGLLEQIVNPITNPIILKSPSQKDKYVYIGVDHASELYLYFSYKTTNLINKIVSSKGYEMISSNDPVSVNADSIFSRFKIRIDGCIQNIFQNTNEISNFIYELCLLFICQDQNKVVTGVSKEQLCYFLKLVLNSKDHNKEDVYSELLNVYQSSSYFSGLQAIKSRLFEDNFTTLQNQLQKEMSRFFMDGEEAQKYIETMYLQK